MPIISGGSAGSGGLAVLFNSTLGADTASIDTGAGGIAGGFNILQVWIIARTDDAAVAGELDVNVNNDSGANYDLMRMSEVNTTQSGAPTLADTAWRLTVRGNTGGAGYASTVRIAIPGYTQTNFNKVAELLASSPDTALASSRLDYYGLGWRSTAAISRMKIAALGAAKLKAGSRLIVCGS